MPPLDETTPQCGSSFLIGLPEGTPRIKYTNMKGLDGVVIARRKEYSIDNSQSSFLIVTSAPSTILKEFDDYYGERGPKIEANIQENTLIVEVMLLKPHEYVRQRLAYYIENKIMEMGLEEVLIDAGSARYENGSYVKEPDGAFELSYDRLWPTLAIEVGLSEGETKLAIDAQGWLEAAGSRCQVVITAKIDRETPRITFQRWQRSGSVKRYITRHYQPVALLVEEVIASHDLRVTKITGSLTLPFEKLFCRPSEGGREADISLTPEMLRKVGELVWRCQGFI